MKVESRSLRRTPREGRDVRSAFFLSCDLLSTLYSRGYGYLSDQLNRASLSIAANIAEGNGRFTKADRKSFFIIARGSVQECVPLLELAMRRNLISTGNHQILKSQLEEISKMLSGLINGLDKRG